MTIPKKLPCTIKHQRPTTCPFCMSYEIYTLKVENEKLRNSEMSWCELAKARGEVIKDLEDRILEDAKVQP